MLRATSWVLMLASSAALAGQPKWISMQNENFHVYSSANERDTRAALNQLERVRGFFTQLTGSLSGKSASVSVVIFGSDKEYRPYRPNNVAAAYYSRHSDRDLIVVGPLDAQSSLVMSHEYTHLVFRHDGYDLPPWLNEGLAELFSTLRPLGNDTSFGDVLPGHMQELNRGFWVPMATILAVNQDSSYYNDRSKAPTFYAQSWAFVHMLATTDKYRPKFWDFVHAVNSGTPSVKALEATYGVPLSALEAELRSYVSADSFNMLRIRLSLGETESIQSEPADPLDVREAQAEIIMGLDGRQDEARGLFEALAREDGKRPEPWANLGYLAWRGGKAAEAQADFDKAFALGSRSSRLLLDLAQMEYNDRPANAAAALTRLLEVEPRNLEGILTLASLQMNQGQFAEALATSREVTTVRTDQQRDRLLYLRAFASVRVGDLANARKLADTLKQATSDPDLQARADDILHFLDKH